jgi:hypothetical protein
MKALQENSGTAAFFEEARAADGGDRPAPSAGER